MYKSTLFPCRDVGSGHDGVPVWWEEVNGLTPSEPRLVVPEWLPAAWKDACRMVSVGRGDGAK